MANTNQTFYLPRFFQYIRAHFSEKMRTYFWHFAIIAMIYFVILLMLLPKYEVRLQMFFYYSGLFTTGGVFALRYFSQLGRVESALIQLMQPASTIEKWLLAIIVTVVLYPLIYTGIYAVMTYPITLLVPSTDNIDSIYDYQLFLPLVDIGRKFTGIRAIDQVPLWIMYISICAYALTTSVIYKRLPAIKSVALAFGLFLVYLFFAIAIEPNGRIVFSWFSYKTNEFSLVSWMTGLLVWVLAPLFMLIASYLSLKERDL